MHGHAYANGAGTIVNAIAIWKGAAFCIDLKTTADIELHECAGGGGRITGRIKNAATGDTGDGATYDIGFGLMMLNSAILAAIALIRRNES